MRSEAREARGASLVRAAVSEGRGGAGREKRGVRLFDARFDALVSRVFVVDRRDCRGEASRHTDACTHTRSTHTLVPPFAPAARTNPRTQIRSTVGPQTRITITDTFVPPFAVLSRRAPPRTSTVVPSPTPPGATNAGCR